MDLTNEALFYISGRHSFLEDTLYLGYSASYIEFMFCGKRLEAELASDGYTPEEHMHAMLAVFYDEEELPYRIIKVEHGTSRVTIFEANQERTVKIRLMKYSEAAFSSLGIKDLYADGKMLPYVHEAKKLFIEFIGDSITCGYGIEAENELCQFQTDTEDPWEAFACKTARKLDADFSLVSWSGNGIISHYVDPSVNERRVENGLMPDIYPYADFDLFRRKEILPSPEWEYKREPDIIVINLGTNDASYTRGMQDRGQLFCQEYEKFLHQIRDRHPKATVIGVYGMMNPDLNEEIKTLYENMHKTDARMLSIEMPLQSAADGMGADFHPSKYTHERTAARLARFIRELEL